MRTLIAVAAATLLSGCYSYVKTYDGKGNLIAECNSGGMWLGFIPVWVWTPVPSCTGSANPSEQTGNAVLNVRKEGEFGGDKFKVSSCPEGTEWSNNECRPRTLINDMMRKKP